MLPFFLTILLICSNLSNAADTQPQNCSPANKVNYALAQKLVAKIVEDKEKHNTILDVDCRTGEITAHIAQVLPEVKVFGIVSKDDAESLEATCKKFNGVNNLSFVQGTITPGKDTSYLEKSCSPGQFSGITSFSSLHWLPHPHVITTIKSMHTALKVGGTCYLLLAGKRTDEVQDLFTVAVDAAMKQEPWYNKFEENETSGLDDTIRSYKEEDFRTIAQNTGFVPHSVSVEAVEHTFPSVEQYKEWLFAVSPYETMLGEHHNEFINAVAQEYVKICPPELDGTLTYKDYMLYAILKKQK